MAIKPAHPDTFGQVLCSWIFLWTLLIVYPAQAQEIELEEIQLEEVEREEIEVEEVEEISKPTPKVPKEKTEPEPTPTPKPLPPFDGLRFTGLKDGMAHQICRLVNLRPQKEKLHCAFEEVETELEALKAVQLEQADFASASRDLVESAWTSRPPFSSYYYKLRRVLSIPSSFLAWLRIREHSKTTENFVLGTSPPEVDRALKALQSCDSDQADLTGSLSYLTAPSAYQALLEERIEAALLFWPIDQLMTLEADFEVDFLTPSCQDFFVKEDRLARSLPVTALEMRHLPDNLNQIVAHEDILVVERNVDVKSVEALSELVANHSSAISDLIPNLRFLNRQSLFKRSRLPLHAGARKTAEKENLLN